MKRKSAGTMHTSTATGFTRPVIILHGIGDPKRTLEPGEQTFWLSKEEFLTVLDRIVEMGNDAPLITFDDGNASDVEVALPELAARKLKAVFFLLTSRIDTPGSLGRSDLDSLINMGHEIGLHGHAHIDWRGLSPTEKTQEFQVARNTLSELAGVAVTVAAAPFGLYDRQTVHDLRDLGFAALYTSDRGLAHQSAFIRPRNCLEGGMTQTQLDAALMGRVGGIRKVRRMFGIARKRLLPLRVSP